MPKGFSNRKERKVDVVLQVTEPAKESETVLVQTSTYSSRNKRVENRAKANERLARPEGTRVTVIASGESGEFDDLIGDAADEAGR